MLYHDSSYKRERGHNNLNPEVKTEQITTEGYSLDDLNMYYSGTYVLKHIEKRDRYIPVYISEVRMNDEDVLCFHYIASSGKSYTRPCTEFWSMFIPFGVYLNPVEDSLFKCNLSSGGYKKSLHSSNLSITYYSKYHGGWTNLSSNIETRLRFLTFVMYPEDKGIHKGVLSRRLYVRDDQIRLSHPDKQIAEYNFETNTVISPCTELFDRLSEKGEGVKCVLMN